jgi:diguanylate cyclase (GGDEF)-like protein/PAS domain S-box-containing protein
MLAMKFPTLRQRLPFLLPAAAILALLLGLTATAGLFAGMRHVEHRAVANDFEQRAEIRIAAVRRGMTSALGDLQVLNELFVTSDDVDREQFRAFTRPLLERAPYIQAFNFHRYVTLAERPQYEAALRAQLPNFAITEFAPDLKNALRPAGSRPVYRVVEFVEPMSRNGRVLGFDADSYEAPREAMMRAVDTGRAASTGLLRLVQEPGSQRGFIVMMPLYRRGATLNDVNARRAAAIGDTAAVFRAGDLFQRVLADAGLIDTPDIALAIYAGKRADEASRVFRNGPEIPPEEAGNPLLPRWLWRDHPDAVAATFEVAGVSWHIEIASPPRWFASGHNGSLITLISGILASIAGAIYLQRLATRSQRVQALVYDRTLELRMANDLLSLDIEARIKAERALRLRDRAIEACANGIILIDARKPGLPVEYVNAAYERITGYSAEETIGRSSEFLLFQHPQHEPGLREIRAAMNERRPGNAVIYGTRKDGSPLWSDLHIAPVRDEADEVSHFVVVKYDITETRRYQEELEFQSSRDTLTGLANRHLLRDRITQAVAYAGRYRQTMWVAYVGLDRFKFVNDTLGHEAGDTLLREVAKRLQVAVRETDTVARLGGDEFVLVLTERAEDHLSGATLQRILDAVTAPVLLEGHDFFFTCSAGVAVYPADGETPDQLLKHADIALHRAKDSGRNNFQFYAPGMNARALERLRLEADLRTALDQRQFVLHYQPQVSLDSGAIVGMEALLRWNHPELGMVAPDRFIALAEETGLIVPIGAWVLREACAQTRAWRDAGLPLLRVAVNISPRQFAQQDLVQSIAAVLADTGLEAHCLELELTESVVMADVERAVATLDELKGLGVKLSIDDFGTGYSSLSYLKRFPIDVLKIDRSFVRDITDDPDDAAIAVLIIDLAHSLGLQVIAEGVETAAQLDFLRAHHCDQMQGYYFSRPQPAEQFIELVRSAKVC